MLQHMYRALVLLLAAAALTTGIAAPAAGRSAAKPTLTVLDRTPLQVHGVHFKLRERVRVTATSDTSTAVRVLRTSPRGSFMVNLGRWDYCNPVTVEAVGARGDRATLIVASRPPVDGPCLGL
jgi:hypothetical protein